MTEDFKIIGMGFGTVQVCTSLETVAEIIERLQRELDAIWEGERDLRFPLPPIIWQTALQCGGSHNPYKCDESESHKHYLLEC